MSYDVDLVITTGNNETSVYSRNHTSNTSQMWREAGCDIAEFDGRPAVDLGSACAAAMEDIGRRPDHYRQYEPANKWGTVESTLDFLNDLLEATDRHYMTTVRVCR